MDAAGLSSEAQIAVAAITRSERLTADSGGTQAGGDGGRRVRALRTTALPFSALHRLCPLRPWSLPLPRMRLRAPQITSRRLLPPRPTIPQRRLRRLPRRRPPHAVRMYTSSSRGSKRKADKNVDADFTSCLALREGKALSAIQGQKPEKRISEYSNYRHSRFSRRFPR